MFGKNGIKLLLVHTWLAIIPGVILPALASSGHFGQRKLFQNLVVGSSTSLSCFPSADLYMELKIGGQLKVPEQLGQVNVSGVHP